MISKLVVAIFCSFSSLPWNRQFGFYCHNVKFYNIPWFILHETILQIIHVISEAAEKNKKTAVGQARSYRWELQIQIYTNTQTFTKFEKYLNISPTQGRGQYNLSLKCNNWTRWCCILHFQFHRCITSTTCAVAQNQNLLRSHYIVQRDCLLWSMYNILLQYLYVQLMYKIWIQHLLQPMYNIFMYNICYNTVLHPSHCLLLAPHRPGSALAWPTPSQYTGTPGLYGSALSWILAAVMAGYRDFCEYRHPKEEFTEDEVEDDEKEFTEDESDEGNCVPYQDHHPEEKYNQPTQIHHHYYYAPVTTSYHHHHHVHYGGDESDASVTDESDASVTDDGYEEEEGKDATQKSQTRVNKVSTWKACSPRQEQQGKQDGGKRRDEYKYKDKATTEQTKRRRTKNTNQLKTN